MDLARIPTLDHLVNTTLDHGTADAELLAHAQNFRWDERPPMDGVEQYAPYFQQRPMDGPDTWNDAHEDYVSEQLHIPTGDRDFAWTFRAANDSNRLRQIDPRLYLLRVEDATWPCQLIGTEPEELRRRIAAFQANDPAAQTWLERFTDAWNKKRDQRPQFATTELEVEDLLNQDNWAERLRDRLGLGHYSPLTTARPEVVLLMRYTVAEVIAALAQGMGHPAVPTVLDGGLSPFFFPSPMPGPDADGNPYYGHSLNLGQIAPGEAYRMGIELLHPRLEYRPEHLFRVGEIALPYSQDLGTARRLHLPELQLFKDRLDFGVPA